MPDPTLFDLPPEEPDDIDEPRPGLVRRDHPPTSRLAALAIMPASGTARRACYDCILAGVNGKPGATSEEIEIATGLKHQTVGPRLRELVQGGHIRDSGDVRMTTSDRAAIIWEATQPTGATPCPGATPPSAAPEPRRSAAAADSRSTPAPSTSITARAAADNGSERPA